jgi:hypothetical protein
MGAKTPRGYGMIGKGGHSRGYKYAHRLSYEIHNGQIPQRLNILHKCDNPSCVNPKHLFLGTQKDNINDMFKKGRGMKGEKHVHAILSNKIARDIRKEYSKGKTSLSILGRKYGICFQHVHDIIKKRIWKDA